jgi:ADP-ribose pyrophosphatase YjhB (NUDIX family)
METIICSGPVIIENGKVLLNKEQKDYGQTPWFFPGGAVEDTETDLAKVCEREVAEEMGIKIKIIKQLPTTTHEYRNKKIILHHFLAERLGEIKPGKGIIDWGWFPIDNLPEGCAPNVVEIIQSLRP